MRRVHRLWIILWAVILVCMSVGYQTTEARWVRLGDDIYVGIQEQVCKDGFVVAMAYTDDNQPSIPPDFIPKHIYAIPLLASETLDNFDPGRQPIAEGSIQISYHTQPITGLPDQQSVSYGIRAFWYGTATIRWKNQPDFGTYPRIAIIWADTPVANKLQDPDIGIHGHIEDITSADLLDCYVFGPPAWNFAASSIWSKVNDLSLPTILPTGGLYYVKGSNPYLVTDFQSYKPSFFYTAALVTMSTTTENCARIYFKQVGDNDFDESRMVQFAPDFSTEPRTYWVPLAPNPKWLGNQLTGLRFDPACSAGPPNNENTITVNSISLINSPYFWDFGLDGQGNPLGNQGWDQLNDLDGPFQQPTGFQFTVTGKDPIIANDSLDSLVGPIDAQNYPYLGVTMATDTDSCAQIFFHQSLEPYSEAASLKFSVIPDGHTRTYVLNLSGHPYWNQALITNLRLDPACADGGGHHIRLDNIFLLHEDYYSWDFGGEAQGWDITQDLYQATQNSTGLLYILSGNDPFIAGPALFQPTPMVNIPQIAVTMATTTTNCAQFFFWRAGEGDFSEQNSYFFNPLTDGVSHTYHIHTNTNVNWNGTLSKLRLDPACNFGGTNRVQMDKIVLSQTDWDFAHGPQGWTQDDGDSSSTYREPLFPTPEHQPDWPTSADRFRRQLYSPPINLSASEFYTAAITLKTSTETCAQIYFRRETDAGFNTSRMVQFNLTADGAPHTYQVKLGANPNWAGNIVELALKPFCSTIGSYDVSLLRLSLLPGDPLEAVPSLNYFTTHTPTLTWSRIPGIPQYELQIANNLAFTGATDILVSGLFYTVNLDNGTYFWRVRAVSGISVGDWSTPETFTVQEP